MAKRLRGKRGDGVAAWRVNQMQPKRSKFYRYTWLRRLRLRGQIAADKVSLLERTSMGRRTMQPLNWSIAGLALAAVISVSAPDVASAATVTYTVSGTFQNLSGSYYSALSGGSFSGTFSAPGNTFPLAPASYDYLHNYQINIYTANGSLFSTLSGATPGSYLAISDNYLDIYGGEQITFVTNGTNYLQLVVPVTFNGTGSIIPGLNTSYAEVGPNYAYLATGNVVVAAVPELSTWAMMLLGFAGIGCVAFRRKPKLASIAV